MRQKDSLEAVATFVAVAEAGGFSEAARRLGVSPSAVSQAVRGLEERLGAPLLRRSTRSVSLTDVGRDYLEAAAPALSQLRQAAEDASGRGGRPTGPLRLTMPRAPFELLIAEALVAFQAVYPAVELEIAVERRMVDIVKEGFDAGLRYGDHVEKDMVAIPVGSRSQAVLVAAPTYLEARPTPVHPKDLLEHRGVVCRSQLTGLVIPWTLHRDADIVQITPSAVAIVHDLASQLELTIRGLGVLSAPAAVVSDLVDAGKLRRVLPDWCSPLETLHLYFPSRRHQSAALRAFIAFLRDRSGGAADWVSVAQQRRIHSPLGYRIREQAEQQMA